MFKKIKTILRQPYRDCKTFLFRSIGCRWGISSKAFFIKPISVACDVKVGPYSHFSYGCMIGSGVEIGKYVMCGPEVAIAPGEHLFNLPGTPILFSGAPLAKKTIIEDDVWIGMRVIIRNGVRIGRGAVVAMGAVVVKDVPPYSIVAGVPAKVIGQRFSDESEIDLHNLMLEQSAKRGVYCN